MNQQSPRRQLMTSQDSMTRDQAITARLKKPLSKATTRRSSTTMIVNRPLGPTSPGLHRQAGLTLIEIMVVIVIIGVLAALIVPRVMTRPDEARAVAAKQDVASIMQALKLYRLDNQSYPTGEQGLAALVTRPSLPPEPSQWKAYLDKLPVDPWGRPYQFLNPGLKGEIDVFSLGADGKPGGNGVDADVGNWSL